MKKIICSKCGAQFVSTDSLPSRQENDLTHYYHLVKSTIRGGGSRHCGPVEESDDSEI